MSSKIAKVSLNRVIVQSIKFIQCGEVYTVSQMRVNGAQRRKQCT